MTEQEIEKVVQQILLTQQDSADKAYGRKVSDLFASIDGKVDKIREEQFRHVEMHKINDERIDKALERIEPYIKKSEDDRIAYEYAERIGKKILFWFPVSASVGAAYMYLKSHWK